MPALILHLTDCHLGGPTVRLARHDIKVAVPGIPQPSRTAAVELLLDRLADWLAADGRRLDAVVCSGDAALKGSAEGQRELHRAIVDRLARVGVDSSRIVAVPGNHDVPRDQPPGARERYAAFVEAWREPGCVTPWLDGIDPPDDDPALHRLVAADRSWAVFPVNSANWSHVVAGLDGPLADVWAEADRLLAPDDPSRAARIRVQLDGLLRHDMARISERELERMREVVASTPKPPVGRQVRFATLHHHLREPDFREEIKTFANLTNVELLRAFLADQCIDVVLHGHKHAEAVHRDRVQFVGRRERTLLVVSGSTFMPGREGNAGTIVSLAGGPHVPALAIAALPLPLEGLDWRPAQARTFPLWEPDGTVGGPAVVSGSDIDEVYDKARLLAQGEAGGRTLVVHLESGRNVGRLPLPATYRSPREGMTEPERQRWLDDLVDWWQRPSSRLEGRMGYIHGGRLRRYAGTFDQMSRVKAMLRRSSSSRAVAVLVDPLKDFRKDGMDETFASFCLVQFRRRGAAGGEVVDVIGYYRAQEFDQWWPINVAELRSLQLYVCDGRRAMRPGDITTITAEARMLGVTPTQAAMPAIDRWLDQRPAWFHLIANALSGLGTGGDEERAALRAWYHALDELEQATASRNEEGAPVPVAGLEELVRFLEAGGDAMDPALAAAIRAVLSANRAYAASDNGDDAFEIWRSVAPRIDEVRRRTEGIAGSGV